MGTDSMLAGINLNLGGTHYAILDQGAHALAWQPPGAREVLWCSRLARFEPGVPVRGGVPVIFPWFGSGVDGARRPAHGYARNAVWQLEDVKATHGDLDVSYHLESPQAPGVLDLRATFTAAAFSVALTVTNRGDEPFTYEAALHTYLAVGDIYETRLEGLDGLSYLDTVPGALLGPHTQAGAVTFTGETDRIYTHAGTAWVHDHAWQRTIEVSKEGSASTVVWNPWVAKAAAMSDFGDEEWRQMLCVEAGNLRGHAITLAAGGSHTMSQTLRVVAAG
ncbi:MAG: D-hexose-6-phosphate mutarotase [Propionicimonas sp.]